MFWIRSDDGSGLRCLVFVRAVSKYPLPVDPILLPCAYFSHRQNQSTPEYAALLLLQLCLETNFLEYILGCEAILVALWNTSKKNVVTNLTLMHSY
jgi:hypothetical protein